MTANRVATFISSLRECQLLDAGQLDAVVRRPAPPGDDPMPLARDLIQRNLLTAYQVNQVVRGQAKELVIGPYRLLDKLGEGGMGQVFKAHHQPMDRIVALKIIKKEKLTNAVAVQRFLQEIRVAGQLVHPNIVMAFDAGQVNGTHYFAMEYIEGIDLLKLVQRNGPLPVLQAVDYIRQAAAGLAHAHERGLIHRDIKPSNLLVGRVIQDKSALADVSANTPGGMQRNHIKILDLGLARLEGDEHSNGLTRIGVVIGTPEFLSPEQAKNSSTVDTRTDIYSLGCTFHFLLTGTPPFRGNSAGETLIKHQTAPIPILETLRPDAPPQLGLVVRRMLAKKSEERYQTANDLINALAPFNRRKEQILTPGNVPRGQRPVAAAPASNPRIVGLKGPVSAPVIRRAPRRRRKLVRIAGMAFLGFCVMMGALLFLASNARPPVDPDAPDPTPRGAVAAGKSSRTEKSPTDNRSDKTALAPNVDPLQKIGPEAKNDPPPDPKPAPKPEPAPARKKLPVPELGKQMEVEKTIKEIYRDEYAKKKPADQAALALKLLQEGQENMDNPATKFVLLREARDLAAGAGDVEIALHSIDALDAVFAIDPLDMQVAALDRAARSSGNGAVMRNIADTTMSLVEERVAADEYEAAGRLLPIAEYAARKAGNTPYLTHVQNRMKEIAEQRKEYPVAKAAADTLIKTPEDDNAITTWGRWLSLYKNKWNEGLPLLVQGGDNKLSAAARKDQQPPTEPEAMVDVGDAWWDLAAADRGLLSKRQLQARARYWYEQALPNLSGFSKSKVEKRLKEIDANSGKDDPTTTKPTPPTSTKSPTRLAFDKYMDDGRTAYNQGKYSEAAHQFGEALKLMPDDTKAARYEKLANYQMHMANARAAAAERRLAVAKQEYEAALEIAPNDPSALVGMSQLRGKRPGK